GDRQVRQPRAVSGLCEGAEQNPTQRQHISKVRQVYFKPTELSDPAEVKIAEVRELAREGLEIGEWMRRDEGSLTRNAGPKRRALITGDEAHPDCCCAQDDH